MLPPGTTTSDEVNGTMRHRSSTVLLPKDPSQEELAQYWTLSARDKEEVLKCRGEAQRRRFAI
jgi:hypothetical protein